MDRPEIDRRDKKLLDKQLRRFGPAIRSDGTLILAVLAVFLAGMTVGALALRIKLSR